MSKRPLSEKYQLFLETFSLLKDNPRKFKYRLETAEFSIYEKRLLKAFQLFKRNKKSETFKLLKCQHIEEPFLEAVRLYLIGLTYNQHCYYTFAIEHLEKSISLFQDIKEDQFIINPLIVLVVVLANKRELETMAHYLDVLREIETHNRYHQLQIIQCEVAYLTLTDQVSKALNLIQKAFKDYSQDMEEHRPFFLTLAFMLHFKKKDFKECYQILQKYKGISGPNVRANYSFMKTLLDHITINAPLYVYAQDFKDFPELHYQLEVIKNLASGELDQAKKFWEMLAKHNPKLYTDDFNYQGDEGLFSVALKKHEHTARSKEFDIEKLKKFSFNSDKIHYILTHANAPVSKAEMIKLLWEEEVTLENSARLQKQISRYKAQFNTQVHCYQGTYSLKKKTA